MLVGLKRVSLRIGSTVLLDEVDFSIEDKERVALIGRNGAGKSTLFKVLTGQVQPEDGQVVQQDGLVMASLEQSIPGGENQTVYEAVCQGLPAVGEALVKLKRLDQKEDPTALSPSELDDLESAQGVLTEHNGWQAQSQVEQMIARFSLDGGAIFDSLSGGLKRKVLLAKALVNNPQVLLLDEPTNHLDIPSIEFLEEQILQFRGAVILVSHDRAFMRKMATRVCDLDRGKLQSWPEGYEGFLKAKADFLATEEKQNALFDKRLAQEEVWIRKGIQARRTRNEGRVRALKEMRKQYVERRQRLGSANMMAQEAERSGKIVAELTDVQYSIAGLPILKHFSNVILRGDKIGILGPNGVGKTTAIQVLLGQLKADSGRIKLGTKLEVVYFDQLRSGFDEQATAVEVIGAGKEFIEHDGKSKHVMGYLQDFLFSPERARQPVRSLSGGERARLLLAQLFSKPSNVMVLDEPTNDLDLETLELLEELLSNYNGTVLLVSHDREFIDQIATRCWVFEGQGKVSDYIGGYEDWLRQRSDDPWAPPKGANSSKTGSAAQARPTTTAAEPNIPPKEPSKKLSYKDKRELQALPERIEKLETRQAELVELIGTPNFYEQSADQIAAVQQELKALEQDLESAYARWEELDG